LRQQKEMEMNEFAESDIVWGPPLNLRIADRQRLFREYLLCARAGLLTSLVACPIAILFIKRMHLEFPPAGLILAVLLFVALPWVVMLPTLAWWRWGPAPLPVKPDLYRLTMNGIQLPQTRVHDLPLIRWSNVKWWELRKVKGFDQFQIIALAPAVGRIRKIWLPANDRDVQILSALTQYAGSARQ
jgi:hypothetical protein